MNRRLDHNTREGTREGGWEEEVWTTERGSPTPLMFVYVPVRR